MHLLIGFQIFSLQLNISYSESVYTEINFSDRSEVFFKFAYLCSLSTAVVLRQLRKDQNDLIV